MKIVTYNVNGIKARMANRLVEIAPSRAAPDIVCLQELK